MRLSKPDYYAQFRCIASACPDSCCKEWEVQVDPASASCYRSLPGPLGDRLREVLRTEDGEAYLTIIDGRCPMWRTDGLCRIQAELGEEALCKTCREFPRLTHDYGDFVELGLELSCPEAARFILNAQSGPLIEEIVPGGEAPDYDQEAMTLLKATRQQILVLLSDDTRPIGQTLALALLYGYEAQTWLDEGTEAPFDADAALQEAASLAKPGDLSAMLGVFLDLEILTQEWKDRLVHPAPGPWDPKTLALARYLVARYWLQAVADYDLYSRVKFTVIACLLLKTLGGDFQQTAQLFSKEIENSAENLDTLLDAAYTAPAFTDDKLLGMLLDK